MLEKNLEEMKRKKVNKSVKIQMIDLAISFNFH